MGIQGGNVD